MNLSMKQKQTHRHEEQTCGCQEVMDWEFGISRCKLVYIRWINNKVLLYCTGNYIQYPVRNHNGKELSCTGNYIKYRVINHNGKDLSCICNLYHSSRQRQILNPPSEARNRIHNLMVLSRIRFHCTTMGIPTTIKFKKNLKINI